MAMNRIETRVSLFVPGLFTVLVAVGLASCKNDSPAASVALQVEVKFQLSASVQELMHDLVDPSADVVWEAVGSTLTPKGVEDRQPRTDEEWQQVKAHTILLIEATNLLAMNGRRIVPVGGKMLDEGSEGVLTAVEGQKRLDAQQQTFVQFAVALRETGQKMLTAIEAKDPAAMFEVGSEMDTVCEGCHTTFWYPNQVYPDPKNAATTLGAAQASDR